MHALFAAIHYYTKHAADGITVENCVKVNIYIILMKNIIK